MNRIANTTEREFFPAGDGVLAFGPFELDLERAMLLRDGNEVPLRPKCFHVLRNLVEHNGRLVTKEELFAAVWPGLVVSDSSLSQCLLEIRRALGVEGRTFVRTVPRRGYRFEGQLISHPAAVSETAMAHAARWPAIWAWLAVPLLVVLMAWYGLTTEERASLTGKPNWQNSVARQQYLLGTYFQERRSHGDLERSISYFRRATELDPGFADAWVGLAGSIFLHANMAGKTDFQSWGPEFKVALEKALELDPDHPRAHARMAHYYLAIDHQDLAEAHLQRAMHNGGSDAVVLAIAAGEAFKQRALQRAVALQSRAVDLNPRSYINQSNLGVYLFLAGNPDLARHHLQIARDLNPDGENGLDATLMQTMVLVKDHAAAEKLAERMGKGPDRNQAMAFVYDARGDEEQRDWYLGALAADSSFLSALRLAELHAYLGHLDDSRHWIARALRLKSREISGQRCLEFIRELQFSPFLAGVVDDALLAQANKPSGTQLANVL